MKRLAVILSHPIQYYSPWFRSLHSEPGLDLHVFYLWDFGTKNSHDHGFGQSIQWDIPLLEGYNYEFVPNCSPDPGTHHIWGLQNPSLIDRVRAYQPDVVLLMNYNYASLYNFLWRWRDCPVLFRGDSHRLVAESGIKAWLKRKWIAEVYRRFDRILYVGQANYQYFQYHRVSAKKLIFAPHAIENQRFIAQADSAKSQAADWKQSLGIPENHRVILFAGKFIEKKRPIDLLEAFVAAKLSNTSLLFVGSGRLEEQLRHLAAHQPHIYFAPFQNQSMMPRTYAIADLFILPSYGSGETWGLAVNEAMCLSKAILVSNHVGCAADLVKSKENGLVFSAGNIESLCQSLQLIFQQPEQLESWGLKSRQLIETHSYVELTQGLVSAINDCLLAKLYHITNNPQTSSTIR
jgi:glycosyltransferase involved in cell wall biosynthesis